mmetsp:Transcript_50343/g.150444  ORF Transcript_50343/g.150444 Transcript_50343/m.150444 type:complete len:309 (-) Transcript_50343:45-971(-)
MGCIQGAPECTPEQKEELCRSMGREMLLLCSRAALENTDSITVTPPKEINQLRERAADLRQKAEKAKEGKPVEEPAGEPTNKTTAEAPRTGGGMAGLLHAGVAAATAVKDQVVGKALEKIADQLEKTVDSIQAPLTNLGKNLVEQQREAIQEALDGQIGGLEWRNAVDLVRGSAPHHAAEYKAAKGDALSLYFMEHRRVDLEKAIAPLGEDIIKKGHTSMQAWDAAIGHYNTAVSKMAELSMWAPQPIELDLGKCVVAQTVASIAAAMGEKEKQFRTDSAGKSSCPVTFGNVFSEAKLDKVVYAGKSN